MTSVLYGLPSIQLDVLGNFGSCDPHSDVWFGRQFFRRTGLLVTSSDESTAFGPEAIVASLQYVAGGGSLMFDRPILLVHPDKDIGTHLVLLTMTSQSDYDTWVEDFPSQILPWNVKAWLHDGKGTFSLMTTLCAHQLRPGFVRALHLRGMWGNRCQRLACCRQTSVECQGHGPSPGRAIH